MSELTPELAAHSFEWQSLILMARVLHLHRQAAFAREEVVFFHANIRPVAAEWQRRLDDQARLQDALVALRQEVDAHFGKRYHGMAQAEWLCDLFDRWQEEQASCTAVCRRKKSEAARRYGG
jgi:hypothetical protein